MRAGVEDARLGLQDRLRAVAVVDVPVDDRDPLDAGCERGCRGGGDVVQQTEAHLPLARGVVAGGTDGCEGGADLPREHRLGRDERGADGSACGCRRCRRDVGVGVEPASTARGDAVEVLDRRAGVDGEQLLVSCVAGCELAHPRAQPGALELLQDRGQPRGSLRVPGRGVLQKEGVGDEPELLHVDDGERDEEPRSSRRTRRVTRPDAPDGAATIT